MSCNHALPLLDILKLEDIVFAVFPKAGRSRILPPDVWRLGKSFEEFMIRTGEPRPFPRKKTQDIGHGYARIESHFKSARDEQVAVPRPSSASRLLKTHCRLLPCSRSPTAASANSALSAPTYPQMLVIFASPTAHSAADAREYNYPSPVDGGPASTLRISPASNSIPTMYNQQPPRDYLNAASTTALHPRQFPTFSFPPGSTPTFFSDGFNGRSPGPASGVILPAIIAVVLFVISMIVALHLMRHTRLRDSDGPTVLQRWATYPSPSKDEMVVWKEKPRMWEVSLVEEREREKGDVGKEGALGEGETQGYEMHNLAARARGDTASVRSAASSGTTSSLAWSDIMVPRFRGVYRPAQLPRICALKTSYNVVAYVAHVTACPPLFSFVIFCVSGVV
ncbi:uncharacterized protein BXZ73DRAFT_106905 [Epithele typhae]|uniref:uncharacterized protein n=1 Tax=Epithele typhae TaxID=378194 RepID=UPI0020074E72|nr:uncharacterized protein BXZ73DRAFT_106905 [Epithele typhae]KAH9913564.1 hypothetical protein BXZ73DRAFT_106905 [Epithele typhae]